MHVIRRSFPIAKTLEKTKNKQKDAGYVNSVRHSRKKCCNYEYEAQRIFLNIIPRGKKTDGTNGLKKNLPD
jgi:hypothetical protein